MLKLAYPFADAVVAGFARELDAGRLTHYLASGYYDTPDVPGDDWKQIARVSVEDAEDGHAVRGYLSATVFRNGRSVTQIEAVRFGEPSETFTADFMGFLRCLFETHGMNRVFWTVCVGNPAQRAYDVAVARYGGRVVGRARESSILMDGTLVDELFYEIHADDFARARTVADVAPVNSGLDDYRYQLAAE